MSTHLTSNSDVELQHLQSLFDALLEIPESSRAAWLESHVADASDREALSRLLAADGGAGFLDTPATEYAQRLAPEDIARPESLIGQQIGAFRIMQSLGQGGMAAVFLAERIGADFEQKVAIKLLRRGLYSELEQRLFLRERQVLAALDHPNIAHLIDAGLTAAGVPFLAMEYVDGMPITQYATSHRLDIRDRLELFLTVCRAVATAHRNLIVHRDIKPSNILVNRDGLVKLLDFGIAKLIEEDIDPAGATIGVFTPEYAAPEQREGRPVTTATDVYGLGVLLHELLVGVRPDQSGSRRPSSLIDAHRKSRGADAEAIEYAIDARRLRKLLRGDLDNIVLKALANEPAHRYATASALGEDVERYLRQQPVAAHPPSRWYRARKFIRRHRAGMAITVVLVVVIVATLGLTLWQATVARHQAIRAGAMRDFMTEAFVQAEPGVPRDGPPRITEIVAKAIKRARSDTHMNPAVRIELLTVLGSVLRVQGELKQASATLGWNYTQALDALGSHNPLTMAAGQELAKTLTQNGEYEPARRLLNQLLAGTPSSNIAIREKLLFDSAVLATKQGQHARALADGGDALALVRKLDDNDALTQGLSDYGNVQLAVGELQGAVATYRELLQMHEHRLGPAHLLDASTHAALSRAYRRLGRLDDAEREIRKALAIDTKVLSKDDWRRANHLNALTMLLFQRREFRQALESASESLRIDRIAYDSGSLEVINDLNNVGMLNALLEDYPAAVAPLRESLGLATAKLGAEQYDTANTRANYGVALAHTGKVAAGEAQINHAIASMKAAQEADPDDLAGVYEKLIRLKLEDHDPKNALVLLDKLDATLAEIAHPASYWRGRAATLRAAAMLALGQPLDARTLLASAAKALSTTKQPDPLLSTEIALLQAKLAADAHEPDARALADSARKKLATLRYPPGHLTKLAADLPAE